MSVPVFLCGNESWVLTQKAHNHIQATAFKFIIDKIRKQDIWKQLQTFTIKEEK